MQPPFALGGGERGKGGRGEHIITGYTVKPDGISNLCNVQTLLVVINTQDILSCVLINASKPTKAIDPVNRPKCISGKPSTREPTQPPSG